MEPKEKRMKLKKYFREYYLANREKILKNRKADYWKKRDYYIQKSKNYYYKYIRNYVEGEIQE